IFLFFPYNTVYVMSTFFYSSRRRHTSSKRDWSSDVCSSDLSNASRTMLFNIRTLDWDDEILKVLDIPRCMLPQPMPSSCFYEYRSEERRVGKECRNLGRQSVGKGERSDVGAGGIWLNTSRML